MSARARAQEIHANNLANVATDGFLRQRIAFAQELADAHAKLEIVTRSDRSAGPVQPTGRSADVAMRDDSFLVVSTPDGERYMRGGALILNREGEISDRQGNPISGDGGPISPGTSEFQISKLGEVVVDGSIVGRLRVVRFDPEARLEPVGGGLVRSDSEAEDVEQPEVVPAHRQGSNVQLVSEMVTMVESTRLYEMTARALRSYDEIMSRLISTTQQSVR